MSKTFKYFTLFMVLMVFVTLGAITAADVNGTNSTSSVLSNSVVENTTMISENNTVDSVVSSTDNGTINGSDSTVESTEKYYNASLTDSNSNILSNQNGTIVTNNDYYGESNSNVTNVSLSVNNSDIVSQSSNSTIISNTSLTGNNLTKIYGDSQKYNVTLVDSEGNPIANQTVYFNITGKTYNRTTDANGIASMDIRLSPRTVAIVYFYRGSEYYAASSGTGNIVISKSQSNITVDNEVFIYGNDNRLRITLYDSEGNVLSGKNVSFFIVGKYYYRVTDSNGSAALNIRLKQGNYPCVIRYAGDNLYNGSSISENVVVKNNVTSLTPISNNITYGSNFSVKLTDVFGNPIVGKVVSIKVCGKTYNKTTDANGNANLLIRLNNGKYKVDYSYVDNNTKLTSSGSTTISVVKNTTSIKGNDVYMIVNSNGSFSVKLVDYKGNPIEGKTVSFTLNNVVYNVTTDANGNAKLNIKNLNVGTYVVYYEFNNDNISALSSNGTNKIFVVKNATSLSAANLTMDKGSGKYFTVKLFDQFGNPIENQVIVITIAGKTYNKTTDSNGSAKLQINLNSGVYNVTYNFAGTSAYPSSSGNATVTVKDVQKNNNTFGVYVFGVNMYSVNLSELASNGFKNIFLNYYAVEKYGTSAVEQFIKNASSYGISVHIWMQAFYEGSWVNPTTAGSSYTNSKIAEAVKYANLTGVAGIHLDYLRFPGTAYKYKNAAQYITNFTRDLVNAVKAVNPNIIVSAALMPETSVNSYYYGQDSDELGKYLDIIMPMAYKGNYGQNSSWIKSVATYFKNHSGNAKVWIVLQSYVSDDNTNKLSSTTLKTDAQNAMNGGADGIVSFRYALTNLFNASSLSNSSNNNNSNNNGNNSTSYVTIAQVMDAAKTVDSYYAKNNKLPTTVKIGSYTCTMSQFLYYESLAIVYLSQGKGTSTTLNVLNVTVSEPQNPTGDSLNGSKLGKADYVDSANRTYKFILNYGQGPNYSTTSIGKVEYSLLVETFSQVLTKYSSSKSLPSSVTIGVTNSSSNNSSNTNSSSKTVTIAQVITAANTVKSYYASNSKLPSTVKVGSYTCTMSQFLYYESLAIVYLSQGKGTSTTLNVLNITVSEPGNPTGDSISSSNLNKDGYVDSANRTYKFILNYEQGPNYSTTTVGKVQYENLIEAFSRVLSYYGSNSQLPNYVTINTASSNTANTSSISSLATSITSGLTSDYDKANALFKWVRDNILYDYYCNSQQGAEKTLKIKSGNCCDQSNLYVALCRSVGLTVRYVHGYCHFSDGWYGHVWTEVYVNGKWYSADCVSTRNTFGVINNWNTATATIYNRYTNLPF